MRLLARNKKELWYANKTGSADVVDANGLVTGEKTISYGEAQSVRMYVTSSGSSSNFGSQINVELEEPGLIRGYTHRAFTEDMNCGMDEESIVWYGIQPTRTVTEQRTVDGETVEIETEVPVPHNFKVLRRVPGLYQIMYYLKEVKVG